MVLVMPVNLVQHPFMGGFQVTAGLLYCIPNIQGDVLIGDARLEPIHDRTNFVGDLLHLGEMVSSIGHGENLGSITL